MTGRGRVGCCPVPADYYNAVGAKRTAIPEVPRNKKNKNRRSRSVGHNIVFGGKESQFSEFPRPSVIKRNGSQGPKPLPDTLRDYPTPSLKTPKRCLTIPETPAVLRHQPVVAAARQLVLKPSIPSRPVGERPQQKIPVSNGRQPLREVQVPAWVERLYQPKKHLGQVDTRRGSANSTQSLCAPKKSVASRNTPASPRRGITG